jgi:hypothetical protein
MAAQGHAQVALIRPDGRTPTRVPLGYWDPAWSAHAGEEWYGPLHSAFKNSMSCLQRHEKTDSDAAMAKASNAPPVDAAERERFEFRHLNREMDALEKVDLQKIEADLAARKNSLSPFKIAIDRQDVDGATQRAEQRALLRGMAPAERLKFLRADMAEFTSNAILSAPPSSSGLSDEQWGNFRESRLHSLHPEKLASLDAANAAAKLVRRTLDAARQSTRVRITPFLPPAEPEQKTAATPWVS